MPRIVNNGQKEDIPFCELAALEKQGAIEWVNFPTFFRIVVPKNVSDNIRAKHRKEHRCWKYTHFA